MQKSKRNTYVTAAYNYPKSHKTPRHERDGFVRSSSFTLTKKIRKTPRSFVLGKVATSSATNVGNNASIG